MVGRCWSTFRTCDSSSFMVYDLALKLSRDGQWRDCNKKKISALSTFLDCERSWFLRENRPFDPSC